jgi:hypothetical protein
MLAEPDLIHCKRGAAMYAEAPGADLPPAHGGRKKLSSRLPPSERGQCIVCSQWTANRGRVCRACLDLAAQVFPVAL